MSDFESDTEFACLIAPVEVELELWHVAERETAFVVEPRPLPEGLIPDRLPLGHIAFLGDFNQKVSKISNKRHGLNSSSNKYSPSEGYIYLYARVTGLFSMRPDCW
jgi:hypothetical protein